MEEKKYIFQKNHLVQKSAQLIIKPFQGYTSKIMIISILDLMDFVLNCNNIILVFLLFQNYTLLTQNTVMPGTLCTHKAVKSN